MINKILKALPVLCLALWMVAGCNGSDEKKVYRGLEAEDFTRIASDGIDERRNSYPWAMEQFDGDGDGTPEIYIGTITDALCHQMPGIGSIDIFPNYELKPPERWHCPNEFWDPEDWGPYLEAATGPAYVYRGTIDEAKGDWSWQRVWEPDFDTEVFGFRGARVFKDALYMLSNHDNGPTVWKTTNGADFERASPAGMGNFGGTSIPPGFRGAQVFKDRLYIASDARAAIFSSADPSEDPDSWDQANSTYFLASGGRTHEQIFSSGRVTSATANTLTDENRNWIAGRHDGNFVRITDGPGAGQSKTILSNDGNTLTIEGTWETIPDCTSEFEIYHPEEPDAGRIWQMAVFNDHLYAIAFNIGGAGPTLWKSTDPAPGNWTRVLEGGYGNPSIGFMTLRPFRGHLYIGTGTYPPLFLAGAGVQGCEILRVDADDNVELVVGEAREAGVVGPDPVVPISGLERGFGHLANFYLWYMGDYHGWFYAATMDFGGLLWDVIDDVSEEEEHQEPSCRFNRIVGPPGFDLWRTRDGVEWTMVSDTGFGDYDNYGIRNFMITQWGFFVGVPNAVDGFEIWLGKEK